MILPSTRTVRAYQNIAGGRGDQEDWALFVADLESFSGFWDVTTADTPNDQVKFAEGQRSVFGRIQALTRVSTGALELLERAQNAASEDV